MPSTDYNGLITIGHPYFRNLPASGEVLTCSCGDGASILILIPSHRLELCPDCYRTLAPYLDRSCRLVSIGRAALA